MKNDKRKLLYSVIFLVAYSIIMFLYLLKTGNLISKNITDNILNLTSIIFIIIGTIYYITLIKKDVDLNKHSRGILFWSIIFFFVNIISGVLSFTVYSNLDIEKKEKKELPEIEFKNYTNKWICLVAFVLCMILMFVVPNFIKNKIYIWFLYPVIFTIIFIPFRKELINNFKVFKNNFRQYNSLVLKTWIKSLLLMGIINIIIQLITNTNTSKNQENIQMMFDSLPILVVVLTTIYAPIVEELLFRGVFRKFISNKYAFILISGISFGLLHVINDLNQVSEILYLFTYGTLGCFLASLYYKTNNLCSNIYFHFLQNTLAVIAMILIKIL